jgi:hypothetical protein
VKYSVDDVIDNLSIKVMNRTGLSGEIKKNLLFEYCDRHERVPARKVDYKGQQIGSWLHTQKKKINSKNDDIYTKLATNQYVKNSLDGYFKFKEQNKDKVKLGWDDSKNLLFEYCNINKRVPANKVIYKGQSIGNWLQTQKGKINSENNDVYKKLITNQYVKNCLDDYLKFKDKNKDKKKLEWNELKDLLFEYCNKNKSVPYQKVEYKGQRIGLWLQNQKSKINSENDDVYIKLATNQYIKNCLGCAANI